MISFRCASMWTQLKILTSQFCSDVGQIHLNLTDSVITIYQKSEVPWYRQMSNSMNINSMNIPIAIWRNSNNDNSNNDNYCQIRLIVIWHNFDYYSVYVCMCMYRSSAMHTPLPYRIAFSTANKYFDQLKRKQLSMSLKIVWLSNNNGVLVCLD